MPLRQGAKIERKAVKAYLQRQLRKITNAEARAALERAIAWLHGRPARYRKRKGGL